MDRCPKLQTLGGGYVTKSRLIEAHGDVSCTNCIIIYAIMYPQNEYYNTYCISKNLQRSLVDLQGCSLIPHDLSVLASAFRSLAHMHKCVVFNATKVKPNTNKVKNQTQKAQIELNSGGVGEPGGDLDGVRPGRLRRQHPSGL